MRRVEVGEWRTWRDVRLRALEESPEAFGSTYEQELALPDERWRERVAAASKGDGRALFIAWLGDRPVGCAGCFREEQGGTPSVVSMWVAPEARRQGGGGRLLEVVREWAGSSGADNLRLHVVSTQSPARALYEGFGFRYTGRSETGRRDPSQVLLEMELSLTGS